MKKAYLFLLTVACPLVYTGCSDDDDTTAAVFEIVSSDIGFDAAGGTGSIVLRTSETAVDAISDKSWLTVTDATSSAVSYSVAENADALQRSAKITISAGTMSRVVTILQNGALFDISTQSVELDPTGQSPYRIEYDTSMASVPEVMIPQEAAQWLSATVENGKISLTAGLNYTGARSAVITITQGWKPVEITVTQEMVDLLDVKELTFDRESATVTVTPTEYLALAASSWDVTTDDAWITLSKDGDEAFAVEVSENTTGSFRSGTIDLKSDSGEVLFSLNVSQKIYSYEFFLGTWTMNYGSGQRVSVTLAQDPDDAQAYLMTGLRYNVHVGYEDRGETAALTITCPQFIMTTDYTTSSGGGTANLYLFPTTTSATGFNRSEGIGYDCIYNLNETSQTLTSQPNAATSITINGLIFAGQDVSSGSWINFGNYHPLTSFTR